MSRALAIVLALLLFTTACAGVNQYATGVPARDHERFMVSMTMAAQHRGHNAYRSGDMLQLTVEVADLGSLLYQVQQDQVVVVTHPSQSGPDSVIHERAAALKDEHDQLMVIAREEAWNNKAFSD